MRRRHYFLHDICSATYNWNTIELMKYIFRYDHYLDLCGPCGWVLSWYHHLLVHCPSEASLHCVFKANSFLIGWDVFHTVFRGNHVPGNLNDNNDLNPLPSPLHVKSESRNIHEPIRVRLHSNEQDKTTTWKIRRELGQLLHKLILGRYTTLSASPK